MTHVIVECYRRHRPVVGGRTQALGRAADEARRLNLGDV